MRLLIEGAAVNRSTAPVPDAKPHAKALVLIVEDNVPFRTGLVRLVSMEGHEVLPAGTVKQAMAQLSAPPSHVLLDLNLTDGVGTTILRHIRTEKLPIKVAILSGSGDGTLLDDAKSLHPDAMFTKPPDWAALLKWIDDA